MKQLTTDEVMELEKKRIEEAQKASPASEFTTDDIQQAVNDLFDKQERCASVGVTDFIFLGDLAKSFKEQSRVGIVSEIEVAMPKNKITRELDQLFVDTWHFKRESWGYSYEYSVPIRWHIRVPIRIYVYKEKFKLFDNPDRVNASWDYVEIPNPFPSYWKARHFIKAKLLKGIPLSSEPL